MRRAPRPPATGGTSTSSRTLYRLRDARTSSTATSTPRSGCSRPHLARLAARRRLPPAGARRSGRYLHDPRTQRVFSFQSMYAGLSPYDALALYAVIAYMDSVAGVYFPRGGMHAVPARAGRRGGEARRRRPVRLHRRTRSRRPGDGRRAVHTTDGERIGCDAVVLNPDLPVAYRDLLGREPWSVRRLRYSPSCFLLLAGSTATYGRTRAPQHPLRRRLATGLRRGHRTRAG